MPHAAMQESDRETPVNSPPPPSQEGYTISVQVSPEGFLIDGESAPDLTTALKHIIAIVRAHPLTGNAHDELKSGYESP